MKKILFLLFFALPFLASAQYAYEEVYYFDNGNNVLVQIESSGKSYLTFRNGSDVVLEFYDAKVQKNYVIGTESWLEFVKGSGLSLQLAYIRAKEDYTNFGVNLNDGRGSAVSFSTKDYNKTRENREKFLYLKSLLK